MSWLANLKADETSWTASPIIHPEGLGNLPSTFIITAGWDPSRDDNLIADIMLHEADTKTRLKLYQGTSHLFWLGFPDLEVTKQWMKDQQSGVEWLLAGGK
jgi:acetyl esterase/lipase